MTCRFDLDMDLYMALGWKEGGVELIGDSMLFIFSLFDGLGDVHL